MLPEPINKEAEVIHMIARTSSPQVEDGFTRIANELLDAVIAEKFSARQYAVVLAVMRKTYGFNKKTDDIGLSQIEKMTGVFKSHLSVTVRELSDMRVLLRTQGRFGHKLSINKHYKQWGVTETVTGGVTVSVTVTNSVTGGVTDSVTTPVTESVTTKDNHPKDNQPKERYMRNRDCAHPFFSVFWESWPLKKDRQRASVAFSKINPDDDLLKTILVAIAEQTKSAEWIEQGGKFIPHPTTWLNGKRWEDEVSPVIGEFTEQQKAFIEIFNSNIGDVCAPVGDWSQKAADLINIALSGTWKADRFEKYFKYVSEKCRFKYPVSFEWLLTRDNLVRVKRGDFDSGEA